MLRLFEQTITIKNNSKNKNITCRSGLQIKQLTEKKITGKATTIKAKRVSILKLIEIAPTTIKKIEPGPRIEETSIMN